MQEDCRCFAVRLHVVRIPDGGRYHDTTGRPRELAIMQPLPTHLSPEDGGNIFSRNVGPLSKLYNITIHKTAILKVQKYACTVCIWRENSAEEIIDGIQDLKKKVKLSLQHAVEAHRVVRRRGSHIL
jgi:hypothetical protein